MIGQPEIDAGLAPRHLAQHRNHIFAGRARQDRAAQDQHVPVGLEGERPGDILASLQHIAQIEIAVVQARRSHADEARLGIADGLLRVGGRPQGSRKNGALDELRHPRLADRRLAGVDSANFLGGNVDRHDLVTFLGHAGGENRADISDAENADLHRHAPKGISWMSKSTDSVQCRATMPMGLPEISRTTAMAVSG